MMPGLPSDVRVQAADGIGTLGEQRNVVRTRW